MNLKIICLSMLSPFLFFSKSNARELITSPNLKERKLQ